MRSDVSRRGGSLWAAAGCVTGPVLLLVLLVVVVRTNFGRYTQASGSMEPTLAKGDLVLVRPAGAIARGDLVVFPAPVGAGVVMKRVVGLPGERIELRDNRTVVNGVALAEPYIAPNDDTLPENARFRNMPPTIVPSDTVFVLGDNRDHSNDSRFFGPVKRSAVSGRVVLVVSQRSGIWRS